MISEIETITGPALLTPLSDESRPEPGPLTNTSTDFIPCATIRFTTSSTAILAAYGVDFRVPLNPREPDELQPSASPLSLVTVTNVLLNVAVMYTRPCSVTGAPAFFFAFVVTFLVCFAIMLICYYFPDAFAFCACSCLAITSFLIAPMVTFLPRFVRALDLVRCPRTGKPCAWRIPR